jgi:hypothetical protein
VLLTYRTPSLKAYGNVLVRDTENSGPSVKKNTNLAFRGSHHGFMLNTNSATAAAKLEKEQALAKLRAMQTADLRVVGSTANRPRTMAQAFASLRDRALGMSDRIASRGTGGSAEEVRAIVDTEVRDLLGTVSRGEFLARPRRSAGSRPRRCRISAHRMGRMRPAS